jgi:hypothetical protein
MRSKLRLRACLQAKAVLAPEEAMHTSNAISDSSKKGIGSVTQA